MHPRPAALLAAFFVSIFTLHVAASELGRRTPPELRPVLDPGTGRVLLALTTSPASDLKLYQTHPQWAADGVHVIFRSSDRNPARTPQAYAVHTVTGDITQLTTGEGVGTYSLNVARLSNRLYYLRTGPDARERLVELELTPLLADSAAGAVKAPETYERVLATLPADHRGAGGFALDADERTAYFGVRLADAPPREPGKPIPQVPSGIRAVDLATGEYRTVIDTPFLMGHVQTNPWVPGEIIYCNETGGDAPQRMWAVQSDGSGNRPLFPESPDDWVTHEIVSDRDTVLFNLMGHTPELRRRPTGVMALDLRTGEVSPLGQTPRGQGFWHCNGTPDGKWAVADNFTGEIHLINRRTGELTLVSTGHVMKPDHTHPNFSPDGRAILVQSGLLTAGQSLDLILIPVPETAD
ncbi:MAG: oligogalacturonate lyase family protein [Opitutaceae bacterium]|jgi:oligogalacturonide lyase|nr:oligogalacturonate lyase family protein [Opitutaceae bacterium]